MCNAMASSSVSKPSRSEPRTSCHAPLKQNYLEIADRIVQWETFDFRYKAPLNPADLPPKRKKRQGKHKKESSKNRSQESKPETSNACATITASTEGSTSAVNDSSTSDLHHSGSNISMLPQCCLLKIFCYLPICHLLRAGLACKSWQQLSLAKSIWKNVALADANILSWTRAAKVLHSHGTIALDFYNIANEGKPSWNNMYCIVQELPGLRYLHFAYAHIGLLSKVTQHLPDLRVLEVCWLINECSESIEDGVTFDLGKLSKLTQLRELKIRSISSLLQPAGGLKSLENLQHLKKLSLTSLREYRISPLEYEFLGKLPELVELELGDCGNWVLDTYEKLSELTKLRSLRLENGGCWCNEDSSLPCTCTCNIAESLKKLTQLEKLELIMYTMPSDINPALQSLLSLRTLTFWPRVCLRGHVRGHGMDLPWADGCEAPDNLNARHYLEMLNDVIPIVQEHFEVQERGVFRHLWWAQDGIYKLDPMLIQTNLDKCKALGNLQHLRHLTWGVPIITFDSPQKEYPFNVTTERALKSWTVLELTDMLAKQLPETAVNVLIVPVVMSKDQYDHMYSDSSDEDSGSNCWLSGSDLRDSDYSD